MPPDAAGRPRHTRRREAGSARGAPQLRPPSGRARRLDSDARYASESRSAQAPTPPAPTRGGGFDLSDPKDSEGTHPRDSDTGPGRARPLVSPSPRPPWATARRAAGVEARDGACPARPRRMRLHESPSHAPHSRIAESRPPQPNRRVTPPTAESPSHAPHSPGARRAAGRVRAAPRPRLEAAICKDGPTRLASCYPRRLYGPDPYSLVLSRVRGDVPACGIRVTVCWSC